MSETPRGLTFREGGWVLLVAGFVVLSITAWAIAPAVLRLTDHAPGDGATLESYAFDLADLRMPREQIVPAMARRDLAPAMHDPPAISLEEVELRNRGQRSPYLVENDLVVGVVVGGEARAYPLHVLHVHEIINDQIGGLPVAITWHWPSGSVGVFERTLDGVPIALGNSGLAGNGGMLLYPIDQKVGGEQLICQMTGATISGVAASLQPLLHDVISWRRWQEAHPDTTTIAPDPSYKKRYRKASPNLYFKTSEVYFPADPMPLGDRLAAKVAVMSVVIDGATRIYAIEELADAAGDTGTVVDRLGEVDLVFQVERHPLSASVRTAAGEAVSSRRSLWFACHAHLGGRDIWSPN